MASPSSVSVPNKVIGSPTPGVQYIERISIRAIVLDSTAEKIALIHVTNGGYYKLPGGGLEEGETHTQALERELLEEIGCIVDTTSMILLGRSEEYRLENQHQISFCYAVILEQDTGETQLTDEEREDGFEHAWLDVEDAVVRMESMKPQGEFGQSVSQRDGFFVEIFKDRFGAGQGDLVAEIELSQRQASGRQDG